jgi:hypothetical protein
MSYTPPAGNALLFIESGESYTPPAGNALLFTEGGEDESGPRLDIAVHVPIVSAFDVRRGAYADIAATLETTASFGLTYDWAASLDPLLVQEAYRLLIVADGFPDLIVPISNWQATLNRGDRASYLQATIPAALEVVSALSERAPVASVIIIQMGYVMSGGEVRYEEVARSNFDAFTFDRGPKNATAVVRGYARLGYDDTNTRALRGVRTFGMAEGSYRVTCNIDMFLRPGMTVQAAGVEFVASYINMFVTRSDKFCQIGSRPDG